MIRKPATERLREGDVLGPLDRRRSVSRCRRSEAEIGRAAGPGGPEEKGERTVRTAPQARSPIRNKVSR